MANWKSRRKLIWEAIRGVERDYTKGNIDKAIILLSIPMILEMAMESLFAIVDAYFVSKISTEAVAAVGITESCLMVVYSIAIGLSAAATAMVARRIGEKNKKAAAEATAQVMLLGVLFSLLIGIAGYCFSDDLLRLMSDDEALHKVGLPYILLLLTYNLPILMLWMLNGVFRGAGDAATAMRSLWIANGINIVLDPLLIFGVGPFPELGILGAAVATSIGRTVGVLYQIYRLTGPKGIIQLQAAFFKPIRAVLRRLLELAAGAAGQHLIASSSWVFMIFILGHISTPVVAGYTIAIRLIIFAVLPAWGMANAAATLVGQNLGAQQPERAEKSAWRTAHLNMFFMAFVSVVYYFGAPTFISFFDPNPAVVRSGTLALRIIAGGYFFYGYGMILTQALNGAGDTKTPTLLNIVCFWLVEMPLAYVLALYLGFGEDGVYWSILIAESILAVLAIWIFKKGKWKTVEV